MDAKVRKYLSEHENDCNRRDRPGCVTFDFFKDDKFIGTKTYLINRNGEARLASPAIENATAPRHKIILE